MLPFTSLAEYVTVFNPLFKQLKLDFEIVRVTVPHISVEPKSTLSIDKFANPLASK